MLNSILAAAQQQQRQGRESGEPTSSLDGSDSMSPQQQSNKQKMSQLEQAAALMAQFRLNGGKMAPNLGNVLPPWMAEVLQRQNDNNNTNNNTNSNNGANNEAIQHLSQMLGIDPELAAAQLLNKPPMNHHFEQMLHHGLPHGHPLMPGAPPDFVPNPATAAAIAAEALSGAGNPAAIAEAARLMAAGMPPNLFWPPRGGPLFQPALSCKYLLLTIVACD